MAQACGLEVQQHAEHHSFDMLRLELQQDERNRRAAAKFLQEKQNKSK